MKKIILISALILSGLFLYGHENDKSKVKLDTYCELNTINAAIAEIIVPGMMQISADKIKELNALTEYRDQLSASLQDGKVIPLVVYKKRYYWICTNPNCGIGIVWCGYCGDPKCCGWLSGGFRCTECNGTTGACRNIYCQ